MPIQDEIDKAAKEIAFTCNLFANPDRVAAILRKHLAPPLAEKPDNEADVPTDQARLVAEGTADRVRKALELMNEATALMQGVAGGGK